MRTSFFAWFLGCDSLKEPVQCTATPSNPTASLGRIRRDLSSNWILPHGTYGAIDTF
jgi:hypothetical protein